MHSRLNEGVISRTYLPPPHLQDWWLPRAEAPDSYGIAFNRNAWDCETVSKHKDLIIQQILSRQVPHLEAQTEITKPVGWKYVEMTAFESDHFTNTSKSNLFTTGIHKTKAVSLLLYHIYDTVVRESKSIAESSSQVYQQPLIGEMFRLTCKAQRSLHALPI